MAVLFPPFRINEGERVRERETGRRRGGGEQKRRE